MEDNQPKTGKFALNYGIILGAVSIAFGVMLYSMDMHYEQGWTVRVISIALTIAVIIWATSEFKKANSGLLSLSDALKLGTGIGLISAILSLLYYAILTNVIEPGFMDKVFDIAKVEAFANNPKLTDEQWAKGVEIQKNFAWVAYPVGIIISIIMGLIIGLVTGLIMKKEKAAY
ncbi:MAG: DUF4199 domain-containing protein [Maribacter sp.]|nr:DUF4199 domain-containing protein [Maribacter sp.]